MQHWNNKLILITGAGSGIGRALACHFATLGARLILLDINADSLRQTVEQAGAKHVVLSQELDVSQKGQWQALALAVREQFGLLDVLINNAGVLASDTIESMPEAQFDWVLEVNLHGVIHGTRAMLPLLEQAERGMVVNLSSVFGLIGVAKMGAYNTSKFAVRGFTEALRQDFILADKPMDVICVHPGAIDTNIVTQSRSTHTSVSQMAAHFKRHSHTSPAKAARIIERGMRKRKLRILVGADALQIDWIQRLFPTHYYKLFNRRFVPKALFGPSDYSSQTAARSAAKPAKSTKNGELNQL